MLKFIFKTIDVQSQKLGKLLAVLAGVAVFLMMLVVVADFTLVGLKFGSLSISVGLVEMLMIVAIFGAIAYADVLDRHVIATMVISRFSKKWQAISGIFSNAVSLVACFFFTWQIFAYAVDMTSLKKTCLSSDLPYYPFTWFAVAGFFLLGVRYLIRIVNCFKDLLFWRENVGS